NTSAIGFGHISNFIKNGCKWISGFRYKEESLFPDSVSKNEIVFVISNKTRDFEVSNDGIRAELAKMSIKPVLVFLILVKKNNEDSQNQTEILSDMECYGEIDETL